MTSQKDKRREKESASWSIPWPCGSSAKERILSKKVFLLYMCAHPTTKADVCTHIKEQPPSKRQLFALVQILLLKLFWAWERGTHANKSSFNMIRDFTKPQCWRNGRQLCAQMYKSRLLLKENFSFC